MTTKIVLHVDVAASPEDVFDLVCDLHSYGRWLPSAGDYEGTSEISPPPVAVGTTYVEHSRTGVRHGLVIALARPDVVAFRQPMALRPRSLGRIESIVSMSFAATAGGVRVTRTVELGIPRRLKLVRSIIVGRYARESERMLDALKAYAERPGAAGTSA
ncbi:SRPBCC family protein [Agromyces sp. SYSU K20354]|uniref:SRPBCC family protein n=1 Tax=Agromyces cavernae TaxID=2898659 RepID=UPI001E2CC541|nr:SRPBCC family protein [Agromyces cavernae]MCD2443002.1 SRPBCC family protein [Agromyces cavernae]